MTIRSRLPLKAALLAAVVTLSAPAPATQADEFADQVAVCAGCHGEEGMPTADDTPIIWGQEFYYLYVQLKDYNAGRRANDIMSGIAADMTKEQMQAYAKYFSEKSWPRTAYSVSDEVNDRAEKAFGGGQCTQCHLGGFNGNSRVPRLAGQQPNYLKRTMLEFKHKVRLNAPDMGSLMRVFSDEDIAAMAETLAAR